MRNCSICGAPPDYISDLDGEIIGYFCDNSECPNSGPIMTAQEWARRNEPPRTQCAKLTHCATAIEHIRTQGRPHYRASPCVECGEWEPQTAEQAMEKILYLCTLCLAARGLICPESAINQCGPKRCDACGNDLHDIALVPVRPAWTAKRGDG